MIQGIPTQKRCLETGALDFLSADFHMCGINDWKASAVVDHCRDTPLEEKISVRRNILKEYLMTKKTWDEVRVCYGEA